MLVETNTPHIYQESSRLIHDKEDNLLIFAILSTLSILTVSAPPSLRGKTPLHQKEYSRYDTKLHLMVRLQFWRSRMYGVPLHCYYSQVHSDPVWL